jgi:hypothetical protein
VNSNFVRFGRDLAQSLRDEDTHLRLARDTATRVLVPSSGGTTSLDLTPVVMKPQPVTAMRYFAAIDTVQDLLCAYQEAKQETLLENADPTLQSHVHAYAHDFLKALLSRAVKSVSDAEAQRIAGWVRHFDVYSAVKSVESLLNSETERILLEVAEAKNWCLYFDHLAIRCGSSANQACLRVSRILQDRHGYRPSQVEGEREYRFPDGWTAYPLYKLLENGQVLRLFLDESDGTDPLQIIQHWNRVYGYTAHHLAVRATRRTQSGHIAITLPELTQALQEHGVSIMAPTGEHTRGLLVQVFAQPERNPHVPDDIKRDLRALGSDLHVTIENGKLLELLSRREMSPEFATRFFALYGLTYEAQNPLHSAPIYPYFLPAQAAHVIRTSVQAVPA